VAVLGSFNNRLIPAGLTETPDIAIPAGVNGINLVCSRENWPAEGVTIAIAVSIDNGLTWKWWDQFIAPFVPNPPKYTDVLLAPAIISYIWNPDIAQVAANRVKARITNHSVSSFRTDITIDGIQRQ